MNALLEQIKENRESILIENTRDDQRWQSSADDPAHSVVIVPLFGRFALVGLLVLAHEQPGYFKVEHQLLLQAIASQAAIAVENARLYTNMEREQQKLAAILKGAADAIMMFDADACLSMLNPAAEKLFTDYGTKLGLPLARDCGYDVLIQSLEETFIAEKPISREVSWPDGRVFTALFTPIAEGGCVVVLNDVTHFKRLEKVKNEFIATASHDLRNPITSIRGYSQLIQHAGPLSDNQRDFVHRIQHASSHMTELVENMLDLAKMDLGAQPELESLDMTHLLWEIADEFQPQAEAKRQLLTVEKTEDSSKVRGDALQLRQALRNLVGNAIKYTPDGGVITLSSVNNNDMVYVHIRDTGYGIPESDVPHVFDRFYRVRNNGHDEIEGNGLGLAIVKSTAQRHGGDVTVDSKQGEGTCFSFTLPLIAEK